MRKILFLPFVLMLSLVSACSNDDNHAEIDIAQSNATPHSVASNSNNLEEFTLYKVSLGSSTQDVVAKMGYPLKKRNVKWQDGSEFAIYTYGDDSSRSILTFIEDKLSIIKSYDREYKTKSGASVGNRVDEIPDIYKDFQTYLAPRAVFVPFDATILTFYLTNSGENVEAIEYSSMDAFNKTSEMSFEDMKKDLTEMQYVDQNDEQFDRVNTINNGTTPNDIIEIGDTTININTGELYPLNIGVNDDREKVIDTLQSSHTLSISSLGDQTELISYSNENGTESVQAYIDKASQKAKSIVIHKKFLLTIDDFIKTYGEPSLRDTSGEGGYLHYLYHFGEYNLLLEGTVEDGQITFVTFSEKGPS